MPSGGVAGTPRVSSTVWWLALGRLPATTATRMLAPLLGVIAAGLGISLVEAGVIVAVFELAGLTAPAAGWLVDRLRPARASTASLVVLAVAALAAGVAPGPVPFAAALVVLGLAANVYEAASVVWLARSTSFAERAAWMGRYELSWAGGLLVGVPIAGLLSLASWRLAFVAIAAVSLVARASVARRLVDAPAARRSFDAHVVAPAAAGVPLGRRHTWAVFSGFGVICGASMLVVVAYGVWLEERFGLGSAAIGGVAFVLGLADLVANTANVRFTDRLGKTRSTLLGIAVHLVAALLLVAAANVLVLGVLALFVLIAGFEFALLSSKPLLTAIGWRRQGVGVGIGFAASAACRSLAALVGTRLYDWQGMRAAAVASAGAALVGALVFGAGVREPIDA